jgi:hypothetical protein
MKPQTLVNRVLLALILFAGIMSSSIPAGKAQTSELPAIVSTSTPYVDPVFIRSGVGGNVVVDVTLDSEGNVANTNVLEGYPILRPITRRALLLWRFVSDPAAQRVIRLTFVYPQAGESGPIMVLPYHRQLRDHPPGHEQSLIESRIPRDWSPSKDRCKVHGEFFKKGTLEIEYGLPAHDIEYEKAEKKLFPFAHSSALGGCLLSIDYYTEKIRPRYAELLYCSKCRAAEKKWLVRNQHQH